MIDDEELEKVIGKWHNAEIEMTQMKNEMKKLPLAEKMDKAAEMKKLQQQVVVLRTQYQQRTNKVT